MPNQFTKIPDVPEGLLKALVEAFPDRLPEPDTTLKEVRLRQGEQRVIKFLQRHFKAQQENPENVLRRLTKTTDPH